MGSVLATGTFCALQEQAKAIQRVTIANCRFIFIIFMILQYFKYQILSVIGTGMSL
jgi:hypothetical protein